MTDSTTASASNSAQIAEWNGVLGQRWATLRREIDAIVAPFGAAALEAAAPRPGERVLDVGCGCGDTSVALARAVGPDGSVLGVDVSEPMLAVARERASSAPGLAFRHADASHADLPDDRDLLFSRFGVMFFERPDAAFTHLLQSLRPGGRCAFVCWRTPRDNPWAMAPLVAARAALGIVPEPNDPLAPGPFAFADDARVGSILRSAGFTDIGIRRFDAAIALGATPRLAAENAMRVGPLSRLVRDVGEARVPAILDAVERALARETTGDGEVRLNGSTWIVTALHPDQG